MGNIDILVITESELDQSFPSGQFNIDGYSPPFRYDRIVLGAGHGELYYRPIQHATGGSDWERVSIIEVKVFFEECVGLSVINIFCYHFMQTKRDKMAYFEVTRK